MCWAPWEETSESAINSSAAYFSLVRPKMEYCCTVSSPYERVHPSSRDGSPQGCKVPHKQISKYQQRHLHLELEPLEVRRSKCQLTMMFKIINGLVDIPPDEYLTPASTKTRTQHSHKVRQIPATYYYYLNSFFPKTVRLWNSLPVSFADVPSLVFSKRERSTMSF